VCERAGRLKPACQDSSISAIGFASVTNCDYVDHFVGIIYMVDDAVIADPDPPEVLNAAQFLTSWGTGILGKGFN